jgi:hypothetical protein
MRLIHGVDVDRVLNSMRAHGVKWVRLTAWTDRDNLPALASARAARSRGLKVQVVLGPNRGDRVPAHFAAWAARTARAFYGAGARMFSILNEPDQWLVPPRRCWGRPCRWSARATIAARVYRAAVPAVRRVARSAKVLIGETSASRGGPEFTRSLLRRRLPRVDGWAHHPYPMGKAWSLARAAEVSSAVAPLPVYWTEFGSPVRTHSHVPTVSLATARRTWRRAWRMAQRLHVREVVSYGWFATGLPWDTAAQGVLFGAATKR